MNEGTVSPVPPAVEAGPGSAPPRAVAAVVSGEDPDKLGFSLDPDDGPDTAGPVEYGRAGAN
jgi:hypothetical protein